MNWPTMSVAGLKKIFHWQHQHTTNSCWFSMVSAVATCILIPEYIAFHLDLHLALILLSLEQYLAFYSQSALGDKLAISDAARPKTYRHTALLHMARLRDHKTFYHTQLC